MVDRAEELDGYTVNFVEFREDIDGTPLLKGLPDDRCQCPHWGYVIKGRMTLRFADRERSTRRARPSTRRPGTSR